MKLFLILVLICFIAVRIYIKRHFKYLNIGALTLVTGGVKTGKTTLSVYLVMREYKARLKAWKKHNFLCKLFHRVNNEEKPLIYSNVPLSMPYVELTDDLLLRQHRFNYNSVVYICEASLVADSQLIKDQALNTKLLLFNKLFAHETNGVLIYDTQNIQDLHYSIKRSLSNYFYIDHVVKWIPFFLVAYVREFIYSEDNITNVINSDAPDGFKRVIVPKSVWKKFDYRCFSSMTDNLPIDNDVIEPTTLKAEKILSFRGILENAKKNDK
ncbi:MAG: hypothetical protein MJ191_05695 [Clostridium sp.]|nr:hypothetical protein [Clostridium sp.]